MNLFINLYRDKNPQRQKELDECLSRNLLCKRIDRLYCIVDRLSDWMDFIGSDKIVLFKQETRPTFNDFFNLINDYATPKTISVIANSDIYFDDENIKLIEENIRTVDCFALARWDVLEGGIVKLFDRPDTGDVWCFKGKIKQVENCDFGQGNPGCDNAIANRLEVAGYRVLNPSKDVRTYHLHLSGIRHYDASKGSKDRISPPYKLIHPHTLEKMNWVSQIKDLTGKNMQSQFAEDIIINHIFKHIGTTNRFFVDLGAGAYDGKMSNTRTLKHNGWDGFGVDCANITDEWIIKEFVKPDNVCDILARNNTPKDFDFLNLDLDSSDYWVLQSILTNYSPRLICSEINGTLDPGASIALLYEDGYTWDYTNKYGYSFAAGKKLLEKHGYKIIYNLHDTNIFAVKKELVEGIEFIPVTAKRNMYHPVNTKAQWKIV